MKNLSRFFDPLQLFGICTIAGDVFLLRSGMDFGNYIRMVPATLGVIIGLVSLQGLDFKMGNIPGPKIVMMAAAFCGLLYILSGSNLFGFEKVPRYGEMLVGCTIFTACLLNLSGKFAWGAAVFAIGTLLYSEGAWEPVLTHRHFDTNMFGAFLCFLTANILSYWVRSEKIKIEIIHETQV